MSTNEIMALTRGKRSLMDIQIRKATDQDAPAIAELLRSLELFAHIQAQTPETVREQVSLNLGLCTADNSHSVYVALNPTGEIVGYCAVHWLPYLLLPGPEGYVSELFFTGIIPRSRDRRSIAENGQGRSQETGLFKNDAA
jgi:hypothetical protein